MQPSRVLIVAGLCLVGLGLLWLVGERLGLGRLPGDIVIKRKNFGFYFPIVSSIVVSLLLTLLLNLFRK
jgi:hypothetical protein